jgi:DNA-binding transcriptional LysR family regulator
MALEMRHLAALSEIASQRSFGRAADNLGYTQSAVSSQVATLERIVGRRLLKRTRGNQVVEPTPAGELLLRHGEAIADELRRARETIAALAVGQAGRIRVGIYQSVGRLLVPPVVQAFAQDAPGVTVELAEQRGDNPVAALLDEGSLDVAFTVFPVRSSQLHAAPLHRDDYRLLVPRGHPLAVGAPVPLHALAGERLILLAHCPSREGMERRLALDGVEIADALRIDDGPTVAALVAAGIGVAIVPALTVAPSPALVEVALDPPLPPRIVALAWQQGRLSPAAQRFVTVARGVAASLGTPATGHAPATAAS